MRDFVIGVDVDFWEEIFENQTSHLFQPFEEVDKRLIIASSVSNGCIGGIITRRTVQ